MYRLHRRHFYLCKTEKIHDKIFIEVISKLKAFGLRENLDKRVYKKEEVSFLGYRLSYNRIKTNHERTQGIINYKVPRNKKEIQRILGIVNYGRQFIENLSTLACPLIKLTRKEEKFEWTEEHDAAFMEIKKKGNSKLESSIPDWNEPCTLETDASDKGFATVL